MDGSANEKPRELSLTYYIIGMLLVLLIGALILAYIFSGDTRTADTAVMQNDPDNVDFGLTVDEEDEDEDDFGIVVDQDTEDRISISINDPEFPERTVVNIGDAIVWTNNDTMAHTVTFRDLPVDSGNINVGEKFEYTFDTPGTYNYYCKMHESTMVGIIVVE